MPTGVSNKDRVQSAEEPPNECRVVREGGVPVEGPRDVPAVDAQRFSHQVDSTLLT